MSGTKRGSYRGPERHKVNAAVQAWQAAHQLAHRLRIAQLEAERWPERAKVASQAARVRRGSV